MHAARCTARCPLHAARRSRHEARDDPRRRGLSGVAQPPCLFHGTKQSPSPRPLTAPAPARSAVHRQPSTPQNNNLRGPLPVACRRSASAVPVDFLFCFCCFCTSGCAGCTHDVARRAPLCPARQCQHTCAFSSGARPARALLDLDSRCLNHVSGQWFADWLFSYASFGVAALPTCAPMV
jgi:hypothetical protein